MDNPLDILIGKELSSPEMRTPMVRGFKPSDYKHKGAFGMHGTIRDIVGYLGDMMLISGGGKPYYGPIRRAEKMGDTAGDWTTDPVAAAQRLAAAGYTSEAQELLKNASEIDSKKASTRASNASAAENEEDLQEKRRDRLMRMISFGKSNPNAAPQILAQAQRYADSIGFTSEVPLPTKAEEVEPYLK